VGGAGGGNMVTERISFLGHRLPEEIRHTLPLLQGLNKPTFRNILTATVGILEGKPVAHNKLDTLVTTTLTRDSVNVIITGLHKLLQAAIRLSTTSLKAEMLTEDLTEIKIPKEFITDIVGIVYGHKGGAVLQRQAVNNAPHLSTLESIKWRVDVAISTSVLNRVLQPTITMELILDNGKVHHFEVPVSKFHELRYNVASVLKEMEDLEKRSILKIAD